MSITVSGHESKKYYGVPKTDMATEQPTVQVVYMSPNSYKIYFTMYIYICACVRACMHACVCVRGQISLFRYYFCELVSAKMSSIIFDSVMKHFSTFHHFEEFSYGVNKLELANFKGPLRSRIFQEKNVITTLAFRVLEKLRRKIKGG